MTQYNYRYEEIFQESRSDKFGKGFRDRGQRKGQGLKCFHNYGAAYSLILGYLERLERPLSLLEIGVREGASLETWKEVPSINEIVGIDVVLPEVSGTTLYQGSGYTPAMLDTLRENHNGFDCIIDDGPHTWKTQKYFMEEYYSLLNPGGIMVCEDFVLHEHRAKLNRVKDRLGIYALDLRINSHAPHGKKRPGSSLLLRFKD
tara:strand:- start:60 stop:668 length:609 start_codon:yes stop_codon:yes gene_type:complete